MYYEKDGTFAQVETSLANAKEELKTMTQQYSDYKYYPSLKSLYSELDAYAEFLKSPSCSFAQLKNIMSDYESKIRTYQSDLSFIFED